MTFQDFKRRVKKETKAQNEKELESIIRIIYDYIYQHNGSEEELKGLLSRATELVDNMIEKE